MLGEEGGAGREVLDGGDEGGLGIGVSVGEVIVGADDGAVVAELELVLCARVAVAVGVVLEAVRVACCEFHDPFDGRKRKEGGRCGCEAVARRSRSKYYEGTAHARR